MPEKEKLRLDKYLWTIRLFKTRTQATTACDAGKVKFNGVQTKAAKHVNVGEEYEVKTEAKRWRISTIIRSAVFLPTPGNRTRLAASLS